MAKGRKEPLKKKVETVKDFTERVQKSKSAVVTGYSGLTVEEVTQLRSLLFKEKVEYHVVKNTLSCLAFKKAQVTGLDDLLKGPTAIALAMDDAMAPSKILVKFAKTHLKLKIRGGYMDGQVMSEDDVKVLSKIPSRNELLAMIFGSMKAPISGFVRVMSGPTRKLVYALNAVKEMKAKTA